MRNKIMASGLTGLVLLVLPVWGWAQAVDSSQALALRTAYRVYEEAIGLESHLNNGAEYLDYDKPYMQGHQFYLSGKPLNGSLVYDGILFENIPLQYDIVYDQLVITHSASSMKLHLINEKIKTFTLDGHAFIRLQKDSLGAGKTGFYEVLWPGKVQLLARRIKSLQEEATRDGMKGEFRPANRFFIYKENTLYPVRSKGDLLQVLADKKKDLQQHAQAQRLRFRRTREASLLELVRHYNQLSN